MSDLAPPSELSEHGLLSEEEVVSPRFRDHGTLRPPPHVTAPPPRGSWIGFAVAGALATVGVMWLAAGAFAVLAVCLWDAA